MSILVTHDAPTAQKDFCFQFSFFFFKQIMENTELISKTENLLLFLRKSNYSWSENTINQNIRRTFLYS